MTRSLSDVNVKRLSRLIPPRELHARLPVTERAERTVAEGREQVKRILAGQDDRFLLIAGPCSIHDEAAAMEYAGRLAALAEEVRDRIMVVMRVYFEKPRTTIGWKGLINDPHLDGTFDLETGLTAARKLLLRLGELGLPAGSEFLDPIVPQYIADLASWAAIGARTIESQTHRQMASGLSMPVGYKNNTDGNSQIAIDAMISARFPHAFLGIDLDGAACVVETTGNPYGHLVLRGGARGANYAAANVAFVQEQLRAAGLPGALMVDCSHANSAKDHTRQAIAFRDVIAQRVAGNREIAGVMIESHLNPGNQKLGADPADLAYGVSITDACIGWDETASLAAEAYDALAEAIPTPALPRSL